MRTASAVAAPFSPASLTGTAGWWDFSALGLADSTAVSSVPDLSGNARPLVQATGTSQPLFKANLSPTGRGGCAFDGVNDNMAVSGGLPGVGATGFSVAIVCGAGAHGSGPVLFGWGSGYFLRMNTTLGRLELIADGTSATAGSGLDTVDFVNEPTQDTIIGIFDDAADTATLYRNGTAVASAADAVAMSTSANPASVGSSSSGTNPCNLFVNELLVAARPWTATERGNVQAYMKAKFGTP